MKHIDYEMTVKVHCPNCDNGVLLVTAPMRIGSKYSHLPTAYAAEPELIELWSFECLKCGYSKETSEPDKALETIQQLFDDKKSFSASITIDSTIAGCIEMAQFFETTVSLSNAMCRGKRPLICPTLKKG